AAAAGGGPDGGGEGAAEPPRELRCSDCIVWNRQQTWLCVVPLFIGFIGLGLSLMLLKWIVVGSVKEYVPTDLVDSKGMGQDPFFLSKPSSFPKAMETTTTTTSTTSPATPSAGGAASSRTPNRISTRLTTITRAPTRFPGHRVPIRASPRSTTARNTAVPPTVLSTTAPFFSSSTPGSRPPVPGTPSTQAMPSWPTAAYATSSYLHDSTPSWTLSPFQDAAASSSSSSSSSSSTTTTPETITSPKFPACLLASSLPYARFGAQSVGDGSSWLQGGERRRPVVGPCVESGRICVLVSKFQKQVQAIGKQQQQQQKRLEDKLGDRKERRRKESATNQNGNRASDLQLLSALVG
ncbi:Pro-neuregulin-3, membrane-bound isoform, partial [Sciurus carolinensis]|nr:Pro-neuregulin-3, membrane-bound isoform [Sciurus carolinensis]